MRIGFGIHQIFCKWDAVGLIEFIKFVAFCIKFECLFDVYENRDKKKNIQMNNNFNNAKWNNLICIKL